MDLSSRTALVTGGGTGIGLGIAKALAAAGCRVAIAGRREEVLQQAAASSECPLLFHAVDVADRESVKKLFVWANEQLGRVDILVNSAGLARHAPALETTEADYDIATDLNVKAAYFLTRNVAKGLAAAGKPGSLINISSQMAHVGGIDRAVYCATKHAVEGFTKSMAIEWGPKQIRVNTICPTFIRTPLGAQALAIPGRRRWIEEKIKLGRVGEVEDIMGAVVYLASDASALVTGSSLLIDGGWTAD